MRPLKKTIVCLLAVVASLVVAVIAWINTANPLDDPIPEVVALSQGRNLPSDRASVSLREVWQCGTNLTSRADLSPALDALLTGDINTFNKLRTSPPLAGAALDLRGVSLADLDLRNARLDRCNLEGCDFRGADLRGTSLVNSWLVSARFAAPYTLEHERNVRFSGPADIRECDFSGSVLRVAQVNEHQGNSEVRGFTSSTGLEHLEWKKAFGLEQMTNHLAHHRGAVFTKDGRMQISFPATNEVHGREIVLANSIAQSVTNPFSMATATQTERMNAAGVDVKKLARLPAVRVRGKFYGASSITLLNDNASVLLVLGDDFGGHGPVYSRGPVVLDNCSLMGKLYADAPVWCQGEGSRPGYAEADVILMGRKAGGGSTLFAPTIRVPSVDDKPGTSLLTLGYHDKRDLLEGRRRNLMLYPPGYWLARVNSLSSALRFTATCRIDEKSEPTAEQKSALAKLFIDPEPEIAAATMGTMARFNVWPEPVIHHMRLVADTTRSVSYVAQVRLIDRDILGPEALLRKGHPPTGDIADMVTTSFRKWICSELNGSVPRIPTHWKALETMALDCSIEEITSVMRTQEVHVRHAAAIALALRRDEPGAMKALQVLTERNDMGGRAARQILVHPGPLRSTPPPSLGPRSPKESARLWLSTCLPAFYETRDRWPPEMAGDVARSLLTMPVMLRSGERVIDDLIEWMGKHSEITGPQMVSLMDADNASVRQIAMKALRKMQYPMSAQRVVDYYLKNKTRTVGADWLLHYGNVDRVRALGLLAEAYAAAPTNAVQSKVIAQALWRQMGVAKVGEPAMVLLRQLLENPSPEARLEAIRAAGTHLPAAMSNELKAVLDDPDPRCAAAAMHVLVYYKAEGYSEILERFLASDVEIHRARAITSLGARGGKEAESRLEDYARTDPSEAVRKNARRMLQRIRQNND